MSELQSVGQMLMAKSLGLNVGVSDEHCATHGAYVSTHYQLPSRTHKTRCPQCEAVRVAEYEAQLAKERAEAESQRRIERTHAILGKSGIPPKFIASQFANYEIDASNAAQIGVVQKIKGYAAEFKGMHSGRNALFLGNKGTGKTHLACAIAHYAIHHGKKARFISISKLARQVRESKSFGAEHTESQVIDAFVGYDFLIIDEVGLQSGSDAESRAVFDVFNERYEAMRPTLFISNLNVEQVTGCLGERVMDRIKDGGGLVQGFNWGSYRK